MTRRGFTFAEVLTTVVIIGSVAAMAVPKSADLERRATASQMLGDVAAIRKATLRFFSDSGYFPPEETSGVVPESMKQYLPRGFAFRKRGWIIDYDRWSTKLPSVHVRSGVKIGISITVPDERLGLTAMSMYGNNPKFSVGSKYTFLIVGL